MCEIREGLNGTLGRSVLSSQDCARVVASLDWKRGAWPIPAIRGGRYGLNRRRALKRGEDTFRNELL